MPRLTTRVFDLLLKRGKIDESLVTQMMSWQPCGCEDEPAPSEPVWIAD